MWTHSSSRATGSGEGASTWLQDQDDMLPTTSSHSCLWSYRLWCPRLLLQFWIFYQSVKKKTFVKSLGTFSSCRGVAGDGVGAVQWWKIYKDGQMSRFKVIIQDCEDNSNTKFQDSKSRYLLALLQWVQLGQLGLSTVGEVLRIVAIVSATVISQTK